MCTRGAKNYLEQFCAAQSCSGRSEGNRIHISPESSKDTAVHTVLVRCSFLTAGEPLHSITLHHVHMQACTGAASANQL